MNFESIDALTNEQVEMFYNDALDGNYEFILAKNYVYALCYCTGGTSCRGASYENSADPPFCKANLGRNVADPYGGYIGMCGNITYGTNCCGYGRSSYLYLESCR